MVRHAESLKNVRDEHGGLGDAITQAGEKELSSLSKILSSFVKQNSINLRRVYYSDVIQAKESALYIAKTLQIPLSTDKRLKPLNLGVLAGLSREESMKRYPDTATRLEEWRRGDREIRDLRLPKGESARSFWVRGHSFIRDVEKSKESCMVVTSRSNMILFFNMLQGRSPFRTGEYLSWNFTNASVAFFLHSNHWTLWLTSGVSGPKEETPLPIREGITQNNSHRA